MASKQYIQSNWITVPSGDSGLLRPGNAVKWHSQPGSRPVVIKIDFPEPYPYIDSISLTDLTNADRYQVNVYDKDYVMVPGIEKMIEVSTSSN